MSLRRRLDLLTWADHNGAAVIEDDYDTEFRFEDRPLDPLQSLDRTGPGGLHRDLRQDAGSVPPARVHGRSSNADTGATSGPVPIRLARRPGDADAPWRS